MNQIQMINLVLSLHIQMHGRYKQCLVTRSHRFITKLTWDNALVVNADKAKSLKLKTGDIVNLKTSNGKKLKFRVHYFAWQNKDTLFFYGYGQRIRGAFSK